jgi:hypothetical protein
MQRSVFVFCIMARKMGLTYLQSFVKVKLSKGHTHSTALSIRKDYGLLLYGYVNQCCALLVLPFISSVSLYTSSFRI